MLRYSPSTQAEAIERLRLLVQSEDENVALKAIAIVVGKCAAISDGKLKSEIEEIKEWQAEQDLLGVPSGRHPFLLRTYGSRFHRRQTLPIRRQNRRRGMDILPGSRCGPGRDCNRAD